MDLHIFPMLFSLISQDFVPQDHCLAEDYGTKKTSKHVAADEALKILQKTQSTYPSSKVHNAKQALHPGDLERRKT